MRSEINEALLAIDLAEAADSGQRAAKERFIEVIRREEEATAARLRQANLGHGNFTDLELTYAARFRCSCGAGMAYPAGIGTAGSWYCSAILLGQALAGSVHNPPYPFSMYEIKSESQPSEGGLTTRPPGTVVETTGYWWCKCGRTGNLEPTREVTRPREFTCECGSSYPNGDVSMRWLQEVKEAKGESDEKNNEGHTEN